MTRNTGRLEEEEYSRSRSREFIITDSAVFEMPFCIKPGNTKTTGGGVRHYRKYANVGYLFSLWPTLEKSKPISRLLFTTARIK